MPSPSLTLFAHVLSRPDAELDLAQAALLIAEIEYPGIDVGRYIAMLDELGRRARRILAEPSDRPGIERVLRFLYEEVKFRGNSEDYYDPRNSYLNDVLERRTGIPITLALVITEVCKRAGVEAQGVSFPGHFLVRSPAPNGLYVADPFAGHLMTQADLRNLLAKTTGNPRDPDARMLEGATPRQILIRMLSNLRGVYSNRGDKDRERDVLARLFVLTPTDEVKRDLDTLGGERGIMSGSRELN
ncbi:MAG: transglutaminase family protein [Polyangiaceae bacterium]|nr:transglutaminase family protein [Polyangiaceae bacterium]